MQNETNYHTWYWRNWLFKAARANEIIRSLERNAYGADVLWGFHKNWYSNVKFIVHPSKDDKDLE